jgi:hypothetical protein
MMPYGYRTMSAEIPVERLAWAIRARERSQMLLLALYEFGQCKGYGSPESREAWVFSILVGVAFALWRAAFLADASTRTWPEALEDAQALLKAVLRTNTVGFGTEHNLQGWTAGHYLKNAKLRLVEAFRLLVEAGRAHPQDVERIEGISLMGTDPHDTWTLVCDQAERLAGDRVQFRSSGG